MHPGWGSAWGVCLRDLHPGGWGLHAGRLPGGVCIQGEKGAPRGVCIQGSLNGGVDLSRPPPQSDTTVYGQRAGGTRPTGMHFCLCLKTEFPKDNYCKDNSLIPSK